MILSVHDFEPDPIIIGKRRPSQADSDACDIAMLRELADITMALSQALGRLALDKAAEGDAKAAGDLGVVVTRVGRALRQTIAYRRKFEDQVREGEDKRSAEQAGRSTSAKRSWSLARKNMILRAVERVIEHQETDEDEDKGRGDDLYERLDEYERFTDFTDCPVSAFVATLCDAMGLELDWAQFAHDALGGRRGGNPAGRLTVCRVVELRPGRCRSPRREQHRPATGCGIGSFLRLNSTIAITKKPLACETGEGGTHCASNGRMRVHGVHSSFVQSLNPPHLPTATRRAPSSPASGRGAFWEATLTVVRPFPDS
jgi:hypothetical protein